MNFQNIYLNYISFNSKLLLFILNMYESKRILMLNLLYIEEEWILSTSSNFEYKEL